MVDSISTPYTAHRHYGYDNGRNKLEGWQWIVYLNHSELHPTGRAIHIITHQISNDAQ